MVNKESTAGVAPQLPISERLWQSCNDLARAALTGAFVSQLAAGTLKKVSFQHYIAQDAFFLAAFSEVYERAERSVEDAKAKGSLRELREGVVEELGMHAGYAKAWDINLEDYAQPSAATKAYIDFLRRSSLQASASSFSNSDGGDEAQPNQAPQSNGACRPALVNGQADGSMERDGGADVRAELGEPTASRPHLGEELRVENRTSAFRGDEAATRNQADEGHERETAGVARMIAAMVPCMRLYAFLGHELQRERDLAGHPYREWIETYASSDFQAAAAKLESVLESVRGQATPPVDLLPIYREAMLLELEFFASQPGL